MSLLQETKFLLRKHRIRPKKALGQNFTVESEVFEKIVHHASLNSNDTVLEVGAGLGFLTRLLSKECKEVFAVETDPELVTILREQLSGLYNVKIVEGNVLNVALLAFNKSVSIPPYQISSKLLLWILPKRFDSAVMVFQKEFAEKLTAHVGSRNYGWLAVLSHYFVQVELLDEIAKTMFFPQPKIDSIITRITPKKPRPNVLQSVESFQRFLQILFTRRNRTVRNALMIYLKQTRNLSKDEIMNTVDHLNLCDKRVRQLEPEDFGDLADAIIK